MPSSVNTPLKFLLVMPLVVTVGACSSLDRLANSFSAPSVGPETISAEKGEKAAIQRRPLVSSYPIINSGLPEQDLARAQPPASTRTPSQVLGHTAAPRDPSFQFAAPLPTEAPTSAPNQPVTAAGIRPAEQEKGNRTGTKGTAFKPVAVAPVSSTTPPAPAVPVSSAVSSHFTRRVSEYQAGNRGGVQAPTASPPLPTTPAQLPAQTTPSLAEHFSRRVSEYRTGNQVADGRPAPQSGRREADYPIENGRAAWPQALYEEFVKRITEYEKANGSGRQRL